MSYTNGVIKGDLMIKWFIEIMGRIKETNWVDKTCWD